LEVIACVVRCGTKPEIPMKNSLIRATTSTQ
jgi:hypothetical protein